MTQRRIVFAVFVVHPQTTNLFLFKAVGQSYGFDKVRIGCIYGNLCRAHTSVSERAGSLRGTLLR